MMLKSPEGILSYTLASSRTAKMPFLRKRGAWRSRALYSIAEALYEFEMVAKRVPQHQLTVRLEHVALEALDAERVVSVLQRLLAYVLLIDVTVTLDGSGQVPSILDDPSSSLRRDALCLFSGGIDSVSGILVSRHAYPELTGVFCAHTHQTHVISIVRRMYTQFLGPSGIRLVEVPAPDMTISGYSQLRGFLYILSGAAAATASGTPRLVVSECGPTMYQPRFSPSDLVTMTTHPFVVERAREIINLIGGSDFAVETPFEDKTKAEVIALCPEPILIRESYSCISQRLGKHDGTCFGCVVRRLGALAAGITDAPYAHDPIGDDKASQGNLLALLEFSLSLLDERAELPSYQVELIENFGKWDLFRRYALDNFAALHQLKLKGSRLSGAVDRIYGSALKLTGGGALLEKRLRVLAELKTQSSSGV
jgi:hypothetical protein